MSELDASRRSVRHAVVGCGGARYPPVKRARNSPFVRYPVTKLVVSPQATCGATPRDAEGQVRQPQGSAVNVWFDGPQRGAARQNTHHWQECRSRPYGRPERMSGSAGLVSGTSLTAFGPQLNDPIVAVGRLQAGTDWLMGHDPSAAGEGIFVVFDLTLLQDERLLRRGGLRCLHAIPLLSQPGKRSEKLQLQTIQFSGGRAHAASPFRSIVAEAAAHVCANRRSKANPWISGLGLASDRHRRIR